MKFPQWSEFIQKVSDFEKLMVEEIGSKVSAFQSDHPALDKAFRLGIRLLPPPFDAIADVIYDNTNGPHIDKIQQVIDNLNSIKENGEDQFRQLADRISSEFDNVNVKLNYIQDEGAKENTILSIKEILLSKNESTFQKLQALRTELDGIKIVNRTMQEKISLLVDHAHSQGFTLLRPDHFIENRFTDANLEHWKDGFNFNLESIYYRREYRRENVLEEIQRRLDAQNRLILLGQSGTSKSTIMMEIICHYFDKGYKILYSEGNEELKNPSVTAEFVRNIIREGSKVLIAVDNVHEPRMSSIFHLITLLEPFEASLPRGQR